MGLSFGSDNHSGVHDKILQALTSENVGHEHSYGLDSASLQLKKLCYTLFGEKAEAWPVFNGTAANVLCLNQLVKPYESVLTATTSHLHESECGAPEKHIGCKLITVDTKDGKLKPRNLEPYIIRCGDQHYSQVKALSITQPTEYGTVYSLSELKELRDFCKIHKLHLHIDGARFTHACSFLNCNFKDIIEASGAAAISFGGTKNGLLFGELCVLTDTEYAKEFKYPRKQLLQLPSKQRFISSQFLAFFKDELWRTLAKQQHQLALLLEEQLQAIEEVQITQTVESNAVFFTMPKKWIKSVKKEHFFYVWNEKTFEIRTLISFDHSEADIVSLIDSIKKAKRDS